VKVVSLGREHKRYTTSRRESNIFCNIIFKGQNNTLVAGLSTEGQRLCPAGTIEAVRQGNDCANRLRPATVKITGWRCDGMREEHIKYYIARASIGSVNKDVLTTSFGRIIDIANNLVFDT